MADVPYVIWIIVHARLEALGKLGKIKARALFEPIQRCNKLNARAILKMNAL